MERFALVVLVPTLLFFVYALAQFVREGIRRTPEPERRGARKVISITAPPVGPRENRAAGCGGPGPGNKPCKVPVLVIYPRKGARSG